MIIFGFFAEYIDGALGMAYGVTSSSLILTLGVAPAIASASVHTAEVATTLFAGISHWKFGNIRKDIAIPLIIPGVIGGVTGATLLTYVPAQLTKPVITVFLLLIGAIIFFRYLVKKQILIVDKPISKRGLSTLGFVAAFCDACAGGGWGPIATPTLMMTNKSQPRKVIGSVDSSEFFVTLAETAKPSCPDCPACVYYDEEEYKQCVELFQEVMTDLWSLLHAFIKTFFPEKLHSEEVKEAVEWLKAIEGIEEEIKMSIIHSKELKELISTLPEPQ